MNHVVTLEIDIRVWKNHVATLEIDIRVWEKRRFVVQEKIYLKETSRVKLIEANCVSSNNYLSFICFSTVMYFFIYCLIKLSFFFTLDFFSSEHDCH